MGTSRTCPRLMCSRETGLLKSVRSVNTEGNKAEKVDSLFVCGIFAGGTWKSSDP